MDITTVADDLIVAHDGVQVHRLTGLQPDTEHQVDGVTVRTLAHPEGALLCRFATVNDVHFGEEEAGKLGEAPGGPVQRAGCRHVRGDPGAAVVPVVGRPVGGGLGCRGTGGGRGGRGRRADRRWCRRGAGTGGE